MNGFSVLMFIFGVCLLLTGLYMLTGHKLGVLTERPAFKNLTKEEWKHIGKWTMIVAIIPIILAILGLLFDFQ